MDGTLVFFVGEYYEYSLQGTEVHEKKYYGREELWEDGTLDPARRTGVEEDGKKHRFYFSGSVRIAMRVQVNGITDHQYFRLPG